MKHTFLSATLIALLTTSSYAHSGHGLETSNSLLHMLSSVQHGYLLYAATILASCLLLNRTRSVLRRKVEEH
ncbi:MAG: hypothetical protein ACI9TH_000876 [Kiritimatiellia bacterium]|jgi:hypothetical protein